MYLVHPSSQPSVDKLALLAGPLAAGCHTLIAVNGPSRMPGLMTGSFRAAAQPPAPAPTHQEPYSAGVFVLVVWVGGWVDGRWVCPWEGGLDRTTGVVLGSNLVTETLSCQLAWCVYLVSELLCPSMHDV